MAEREDPETVRSAHWGGITAGLLAAVMVAWWSRPESFRGISPGHAMTRGALWLMATVMAGTLGMGVAGGFTWARGQRTWRVGMNAAAVWVMVPALLLLCVQASPVLLAIVAAMAAGLAVCLWAVAPANPKDDEEAGARQSNTAGEGPTFAELPPSKSGAKQSALIAVCLEAALVLLLRTDLFWASVWLAVGSLLLAWKTLASRARTEKRPGVARARLSGAALAAMAVVVALLLMQPAEGTPGSASEAASAHAQAKTEGAAVDDAYRGIVLFTVPEKKQVLPPLPMERSPLRAGASRPMVIPFDGSYWYFQAPQHGPGLHPHLAHGDPMAMNIYSTGWVPLAMQAHQTLPQPIPVRGGEEFELTLRNADNREGRIDVGVLLTDTHAPGVMDWEKPALMLGVKPMLSSEPPEFAYKANPVEEDLTFAIPPNSALREFDTITVLFFPSAMRDTVSARVGVRQFELLPR